MSEGSSSEDTHATTGTESDPGGHGPSNIPDEAVESESDLALDNLDARRQPGDKQGDQ